MVHSVCILPTNCSPTTSTSDNTLTVNMDKCIVLFVFLLVPCSTMSQVNKVINLTSAETTMNIISPNYPTNYDNNVNIEWQVIAPTGYRVMVQFNDFNLEERSWGKFGDSLKVYDGLANSFEDATRIARLSGSSLPNNITSIGSYLWLRFTSDGSVTETGFSLLVRAVEPVIINLTSEGTIVTITYPNFPNNYGNNEDILWQVIAPTGFRVMVQFNDFELGSGDSLSVYHGLTNSWIDATFRAFLSGSSLPENISSIGSYLWLWFTSDGSVTEKGFSLMVSAVEPDWACDFKEDTCGLIINEGSWTIGTQGNYYYVEADGNTASFTIHHAFASEEGTLSFGRSQYGDLSVTLCKTQVSSSFLTTDGYVVYERKQYSCSGIEDIEVKFTGSGTRFTTIRVLDIQLYETSGPSTASPSTVSMQTTPLPSTLPASQPTDTSTQGSVTPKITTQNSVSEQSTVTSIVPSASTSGGISTQNPTNTTIVTPSEGQATNAPTSPGTNGLTNLRTNEKASTLTPTTPTVTLPAAEELGGGSNPSLIPALSSAIVLILIIMVIIAVFVLRRRRLRDPKVTEPVDQHDDDPNLYNNPVYCSKDDGLPIPDLIISTNSNTGSLSQARHPSTYMDNQYEEFEGDGHPVTNADGAVAHHDALNDTTSESNTLNATPYYTLEDPSNQGGNSKAHNEGDYHTYEQAQGPQTSKKPGKINKGQAGTDDVYQELNNTPLANDPYSSLASPKSGLPKKELQNGGTQGQSDSPAVLDDDEEYNALTFNQSSDITRVMKKPTSGGENVNNGYGVLDLPEQKDAKLSLNSPQLHNDDVYNTLNEGPQEQHNGKQQAPDQSSGYQALKLGQSNIPISHQDLNLKMGSTDDGSTGGYQSLSPGTNGPGPKAGSYERDQPGDESEYHSYQDPREMNQDGSARTPTELDVFSSDNYNILNSGKEVGDYHGYQDPSEMNQDGSACTPTELDDFLSDKYNILNSGKEVGDYHVYQATDDTGVDEGNYEDLDTKMSRENEYSEIDQSQNHAPGTTDTATFEPIYSDEVYSEFQGN